jgi:hypothetical protein
LTTKAINPDLFAVETLLARFDHQAASVRFSSTMKTLVFLLTIEIPVQLTIHRRTICAIPTSNDTLPDPRHERDRRDPQHLPKHTKVRSKGVPHSPHGTWGGVPRSSTTDRAAGSRRGCMQRVLEPFMFRMEVVPQSTPSAQRSVVRDLGACKRLARCLV